MSRSVHLAWVLPSGPDSACGVLIAGPGRARPLPGNQAPVEQGRQVHSDLLERWHHLHDGHGGWTGHVWLDQGERSVMTKGPYANGQAALNYLVRSEEDGMRRGATDVQTRKLHFENKDILVAALHPGWLST